MTGVMSEMQGFDKASSNEINYAIQLKDTACCRSSKIVLQLVSDLLGVEHGFKYP